MDQRTSSIDHLIDRLDIPEFERENIKTSVRQAEMVSDAIGSCVAGLRRAIRFLTPSRPGSLHQH
ncbi:hypothetical protein ACUNV4_06110 [Granulosicoccus sp. 3-233]|uniref:hypothetical protein n=1 Tax=Granulosicoccus sp. 3-233 TaxID=3417969 RepID=UPI003D3455F1